MDKLILIQNTLKAPKTQFNAFGKYKYRAAEDVLEAVKPLLKENGCLLTLTDDIVSIGDRFYVKATARFEHDKFLKEVTAFAREEENKKGMDGSQITGSSSSYARKYALNGLFLIDDTKDADSLNDHKADAESLIDKLKLEIKKYNPPDLDKGKAQLRDKYVGLGLDKKIATEIIAGALDNA